MYICSTHQVCLRWEFSVVVVHPRDAALLRDRAQGLAASGHRLVVAAGGVQLHRGRFSATR